MYELSLLPLIVFSFAGMIASLFSLLIAKEYFDSLPAKSKGGFLFVTALLFSLLAVCLDHFYFSGTQIGEILMSSLYGFGFFGGVGLLLWAISPTDLLAEKQEKNI